MYALLAALLAVQPFVNLNTAGAPSGFFYASAALSLALLAKQRFAGSGSTTVRYALLVASYSVLLLAVLASSIHYSDWPGANGEGAIRLFLGCWLVLLAAQHVPVRYLQWSVMGFGVAGLFSTLLVVYLTLPDFVRPDTPVHNAVTYGNYLAYIAVVAVLSLGWQLTSTPRVEYWSKILVAGITFLGFVLTQTRSGWIAVPVFVIISAALFIGLARWRKALVVVVGSLVLLVGLAANNDALRSRVLTAYDNVLTCQGSGALDESSVCLRLQMYRASIDMFQRRPWFGLGDGGLFNQAMVTESYPKGLVSGFLVSPDNYFGEPHNDLLFMLVSFGLPGFIGLLLAYLAPCWYFIRRLGEATPQPARVAAAMGLALCSGFLLFGLTETMFRRMHMLSFYAVFVAVFLSLSDPVRYQLDGGGRV